MMIANVKAKDENGVLIPLEPLDIEEGMEVIVSIKDVPPGDKEVESILDMFERLRESIPPEAWDNVPMDGAKNYRHYLYGYPKIED